MTKINQIIATGSFRGRIMIFVDDKLLTQRFTAAILVEVDGAHPEMAGPRCEVVAIYDDGEETRTILHLPGGSISRAIRDAGIISARAVAY